MINSIKWLKTVSFFLVVLGHSYVLARGVADPLTSFSHYYGFGYIGVTYFLFIAGYLLGKSKSKNKPFFVFVKDKYLRLAKPLAVVIISSILLGSIITVLDCSSYFLSGKTYLYLLNIFFIPVHTLPGVFVKNIGSNAVNGSLWTLPLEFICYILGYAFLKIKCNFKNLMILIMLVIANFIFYNTRYLQHILLIFVFFIGLILSNKEVDKKQLILILCLSLICTIIFRKEKITLLFISISLSIMYYQSILLKISTNKLIEYLSKNNYFYYLIAFPLQQFIVYINPNISVHYLFFVTLIFCFIIIFIINKVLKIYKGVV